MRGRTKIFLVIIFSMLVPVLFACHSQKYSAKPDEELYGTWINPKFTPQKVINSADGFMDYILGSDTKPFEQGTEQIESKWADKDGVIWYKAVGTYTIGGEHPGLKFQQLIKISGSGKVLESALSPVLDFSSKNYPTKLDPTNIYYRIYARAMK
jgi:hypothetical protein